LIVTPSWLAEAGENFCTFLIGAVDVGEDVDGVGGGVEVGDDGDGGAQVDPDDGALRGWLFGRGVGVGVVARIVT